MKKTKKWSRDWKHFDWKTVRENLVKVEEKIQKGQEIDFEMGISKEELIEYFIWLKETYPLEFLRMITDMKLREMELDYRMVKQNTRFKRFWAFFNRVCPKHNTGTLSEKKGGCKHGKTSI